MAVIQISKIQVRRGLQDNLPQLSGGEFGWSVDSRRLYIGNGTLTEGAPTVGLTEILTEHSSAGLQGNVIAIESNVSSLTARVTNIESNLTLSTLTLSNNVTVPTIIATVTDSFAVDYQIARDTTVRMGTLRGSNYNGTVNYEDSYSENSNVGVIFGFTANSGSCDFTYVTSNTGYDANLTIYSRKSFS